MPTAIYKFNSKERLDEAVGYIASCGEFGRIREVSTSNEFKIAIDCDSDKIDLLRSKIKELNESIWFANTTSKVVKLLSEAANGNGKMLRMTNGDLVRLTPANAKAIIEMHDFLSEENQAALRIMIIESKQSHEAAIQFCLQTSKEND